MHNAATNLSRWSAIGLGFFIPISVALDNILLLLAAVGWLLGGNLAGKLGELRRHPVALAALLFAAAMTLGLAWSMMPIGALKESLVEILRLVLLGVLLSVFADGPTRERAMTAFLASSVTILAISYLLWSGLVPTLPGIKGNAAYPVVFKYHITHNFLMAFAAVIFLLRAFENHGKRRSVYALLAVAAAFNIYFMIPGRTGQLAFAAAFFYVGFVQMRWAGIAAAGVVLAAIIGSAWLLPDSVLHQRTELALAEASAWRPGEAQAQTSSIGMRLEFYRNSLSIIAEHPLFGTGTGSFPKAYAAKVAGTTMAAADHPHNAFLLIGTELGLLGLAAVFGLLLVQWRTASRLPSRPQTIAARSLLILFVVAGMVSSTFNDHAEGLFFVWASALLWAGMQVKQPR